MDPDATRAGVHKSYKKKLPRRPLSWLMTDGAASSRSTPTVRSNVNAAEETQALSTEGAQDGLAIEEPMWWTLLDAGILLTQSRLGLSTHQKQMSIITSTQARPLKNDDTSSQIPKDDHPWLAHCTGGPTATGDNFSVWPTHEWPIHKARTFTRSEIDGLACTRGSCGKRLSESLLFNYGHPVTPTDSFVFRTVTNRKHQALALSVLLPEGYDDVPDSTCRVWPVAPGIAPDGFVPAPPEPPKSVSQQFANAGVIVITSDDDDNDE